MVDYIVISAPITVEEALEIAHGGRFKSLERGKHGAKTSEFRDYGLREVSIWADTDNMFIASPDFKGSSFAATVDAVVFLAYHKSYSDILSVLKGCLPDGFKRRDELEWKVKSVTFAYAFVGYYIRQYYMLLRSGYDLENISLAKQTEKLHDKKSDECYLMTFSGKRKKERAVSDKKNGEAKDKEQEDNATGRKKKAGKYPQKQYRESIGIEVMLDYNKSFTGSDIQYVGGRKNKDFLQLKVRCKKKKVIALCKDYGIKTGDFSHFVGKLDEMDRDILVNYLGRIAGQGRYYRYPDAERKVMETSLTKDRKGKLCDVMKGVSQYKGIANYLSHVEDEEIRYPCMESIRKRKYAVEALNQLQKLGINPINLSVRTRLTESMGGSLPNLIDIYLHDNEGNEKYARLKNEIAIPIPVSAVTGVAEDTAGQGTGTQQQNPVSGALGWDMSQPW